MFFDLFCCFITSASLFAFLAAPLFWVFRPQVSREEMTRLELFADSLKMESMTNRDRRAFGAKKWVDGMGSGFEVGQFATGDPPPFGLRVWWALPPLQGISFKLPAGASSDAPDDGMIDCEFSNSTFELQALALLHAANRVALHQFLQRGGQFTYGVLSYAEPRQLISNRAIELHLERLEALAHLLSEPHDLLDRLCDIALHDPNPSFRARVFNALLTHHPREARIIKLSRELLDDERACHHTSARRRSPARRGRGERGREDPRRVASHARQAARR
jgi:hypothetical protein